MIISLCVWAKAITKRPVNNKNEKIRKIKYVNIVKKARSIVETTLQVPVTERQREVYIVRSFGKILIISTKTKVATFSPI